MMKTIVALAGLLFFLAGIFLFTTLQRGEKTALAKDDSKKVYGMIDDSVPFCSWKVTAPEPVMSENKNQAIVVAVTNSDKKTCESYVSLRAPGFIISPSKEEQKIALPTGKKGSLSWILTPTRTGTYEMAVSDALNTKIYGITVTNTFGLSTTQAKVVSFIGTLLGPMLTVPWWWEKWWQKKQQKKEDRKEEKDNG